MNLGVEGMMLIGAMSAFSMAVHAAIRGWACYSPCCCAGLLSLLHALVTITFRPTRWSAGWR